MIIKLGALGFAAAMLLGAAGWGLMLGGDSADASQIPDHSQAFEMSHAQPSEEGVKDKSGCPLGADY